MGSETFVNIKDELINQLLILFGYVSIPIIIFSVLRSLKVGWQPVFIVHIGLIPLIFFFSVFRKSIKFSTKVSFILIVFFLVSILAFFNFSLSAFGIEYLMLSVLVSVVFLGRKKAIWVYIAGVFVLVVVGILIINGVVVPKINAKDYNSDIISWANTIASFSVLMGVVVLIIGNIVNTLDSKLIELNSKNTELQKALGEIKSLQGILPICSSCKKIRDDEGDWHQMETYMRDHSEAEFSHGVCPDCSKTLYPEFEKKT